MGNKVNTRLEEFKQRVETIRGEYNSDKEEFISKMKEGVQVKSTTEKTKLFNHTSTENTKFSKEKMQEIIKKIKDNQK